LVSEIAIRQLRPDALNDIVVCPLQLERQGALQEQGMWPRRRLTPLAGGSEDQAIVARRAESCRHIRGTPLRDSEHVARQQCARDELRKASSPSCNAEQS